MSQNIPTGKQQFFDINGNPLVGGKVFNYVVSTTTPKTTYQDAALTIPNTNPIILDARGQCSMYGTGNYRQVLQDATGVQIWDQVIIDSAAAIVFPGSLINVQQITASGTYTPTAGATKIIVEVLGGGGAGGGCPVTGGSSASGGGGSSGSYAKTGLIPAVSAAVTIGAGGTAVSGAAGGAGAASSFGAILSCPGGGGGLVGAVFSVAGVSGPGGAKAAIPTGTFSIASQGNKGGFGVLQSGSSALSGVGGNGIYGGGGGGIWSNSVIALPGELATGYGSGGSGGICVTSGVAVLGGNGSPGLVTVYEYAS